MMMELKKNTNVFYLIQNDHLISRLFLYHHRW